MARKPKNNVEYFPHPVSHGKKMFYLRKKFGNDAYVVWFMLLEKLGEADFHYLDLSDEIQLLYLSAELDVEKERLLKIIEELVILNEFDRDLWLFTNVLYNQKFVDGVKDAYKKRNNECIDLEQLKEMLNYKSNPKQTKSNPKGDGNTQSKLNNTKLNKTKLNNTTEKSFSGEVLKCLENCKKHFPQHLLPSTPSENQNWGGTIDKLHRIDGLPYKVIETLVERTRNDDFWSKNFLSILKLRKKNPSGVKYIQVFYEKFKPNEAINRQTKETIESNFDPKGYL